MAVIPVSAQITLLKYLHNQHVHSFIKLYLWCGELGGWGGGRVGGGGGGGDSHIASNMTGITMQVE